MVAVKLASAAVAAVSFLASTVAADVDPIVIKGSKFFYKTNGTEFFMRGVAYQQDAGGNGSATTNTNFKDPLVDTAGCKRDIPLLQALNTNTIRVYAIDTTQSHDECMTELQNAGIYVVADLGSPNNSINRNSPTWDDTLYARFTNVVDTMSKYNNVLGFFAGNEVVNNATNANAMPFVKAAVRDMKAYIKQKNYRPMGVGYAADDDATIRQQVREYVNCGSTEDSVDFFGYNIYSWCGDSDFQTSGYADRTKEFSNYSVPTFFAEYGCNKPSPRKFGDTPTIYSDNMTDVWSGAIVYQYFQSENDFGLVEVGDDGTASKLADYTAFSKQIASATPSGVDSGSYSPTNTVAQNCPAVGATWAASSDLPPTPNEQLCSCMVSSLNCVANSDISDDSTGDLFGFICGQQDGKFCAGITANGTTGDYGAYSMCKAQEQLSFAMNAYYQGQNSNSQACDFGGNATTTQPNVNSQCSGLLGEAGAAGTGVVTSAPSGTGAIGGGSGGTSSGAAGSLAIPAFDFGILAMGLYATVAAMIGAGMILL